MLYIILFPILLISISLHEVSHGYIAYLFGDTTAKNAGRLTLNPLKHIDIMGMIIVPLLLAFTIGVPFGWAKPVPINPYMLKKPKTNMIWIAIAGPISNLLIAIIGIILLKTSVFYNFQLINKVIIYTIFLNLALTCLNLIPIPPLDGSRIITGILPRAQAIAYSKLEPYGFIILVGLMYFGFVRNWINLGTHLLLILLKAENLIPICINGIK